VAYEEEDTCTLSLCSHKRLLRRLAAKDGVEVTESSINQQQTPSQYC
jgi:hypothetical protein